MRLVGTGERLAHLRFFGDLVFLAFFGLFRFLLEVEPVFFDRALSFFGFFATPPVEISSGSESTLSASDSLSEASLAIRMPASSPVEVVLWSGSRGRPERPDDAVLDDEGWAEGGGRRASQSSSSDTSDSNSVVAAVVVEPFEDLKTVEPELVDLEVALELEKPFGLRKPPAPDFVAGGGEERAVRTISVVESSESDT